MNARSKDLRWMIQLSPKFLFTKGNKTLEIFQLSVFINFRTSSKIFRSDSWVLYKRPLHSKNLINSVAQKIWQVHILTLLQNFRTFSQTLWRHLNCSWCHPTLHIKKKKIRLRWSSVNQAIKNNKSFNRSTKFKYNNKLTFSLDHNCFILKIANIALYLSVTAFRGKYLLRTLFLCLRLHEDETNIYTLSSKPHKGLVICRARHYLLFSAI